MNYPLPSLVTKIDMIEPDFTGKYIGPPRRYLGEHFHCILYLLNVIVKEKQERMGHIKHGPSKPYDFLLVNK